MHRGVISAVVCLIIAVLAGGVATSSCKSGAGLANSCSINSDCDSPLVCAFGRCHDACTSTRDCASGERCVVSGSTGVCELPQERACSGTVPCPPSLLCATDGQCRSPCLDSNQCASGQVCEAQPLSLAGACFDPSEVDGGIGDAGGDGSNRGREGGADGGSLDGASGDGGGGRDSSADGSQGVADTGLVNPCVSAQTQFGFTATGDSNPAFTSGVGVRSATRLIIYSSYAGSAPTGFDAGAADAGPANVVYEQAFDPTTANSLGPARPLFQVGGGKGFVVLAAAVAPSGQVALLYGYNGFYDYYEGSPEQQLWAAFVDGAPDAGTTGLQLVQLESAQVFGQPHAIWSGVAQAFVFSWVYPDGVALGVWHVKLKKFLPDGHSAGGDTDLVPTDDPSGNIVRADSNANDLGGVGVSGTNVFGVSYLNTSQNQPYLTLLDPLGNELGKPLWVGTVPGPATGYWVTVAGASDGLAYLYDAPTGVVEAFVPVAADGGVSSPADGGAFAGFTFPGSRHAIVAHGIGDDPTSGGGGAGLVVLYPDEVDFAYVNAGGLTHVGPSSVISHAYAGGDLVSGMNFAGSFGVSLYESATHATQMAASGCMP
jgi:hypothetical protein